MDHVKKKLMKTRHKSSVPREEIDNEDRLIVVWVGQEDKIVCGLTKHTTCEDVVEALLENHISVHNNNILLGSYKEYCIMETWKNFKCVLPPSLKMLKLLKSWGAEKMNVRFFLLKTCTLHPCLMWWTSQKNLALNNGRSHHNSTFHVHDFPLRTRRRIVRKAFRKLEKMKKDVDCPKENNAQQLIDIIISQDTIIKQQLDRMNQLDNQLEAYDSCPQNLGGTGETVGGSGLYSANRLPEMYCLENLLHVQEQVTYQHMLIRKLSDEIKVEMASMCIQENDDFAEKGCTDMETSIKKEIDESLQVGLQLNSLFGYIQKEIQYIDSVQLQQKAEYELLKDELKSVCASNSSSSLCGTPEQFMPSDVSHSKEGCKTTAALSITNIQNDTDSDTGISSTHSHDFESIR
ncbi:ras association domain-containing protein 9 [Anomaloglossus baeobatrachus]|uniref:ras association domain-containing protein 9 n=1 Tax=Anomaloglossus baeobatrachus TaxID=238106 RepID=UPI003F5047E3